MSKLILPMSGKLLLHAVSEKADFHTLNHLTAWFMDEGINVMLPCPKSGRTLFDISRNRISSKDKDVHVHVSMLVQSDPTLLDTIKEIAIAIPSHYVVFEHLYREKHAEALQQVNLPIKSFLSELPYDILTEIIRHCSIKGTLEHEILVVGLLLTPIFFQDLLALAVSCSAMNRFATAEKVVWRKLADSVMPYRSQLMTARGQDPAEADWPTIVRGSYHRTKSLLRNNLSPRILKLDPALLKRPTLSCPHEAPIDRFLLKAPSNVHLLDTSPSCKDTPRMVSSWGLIDRAISWQTILDEETLIVGCSDHIARSSRIEQIAVREVS
jgi:hypothetical protein